MSKAQDEFHICICCIHSRGGGGTLDCAAGGDDWVYGSNNPFCVVKRNGPLCKDYEPPTSKGGDA